MKQYFLWAMVVMIPAGIIFWFLWSLGKSLFTMFQDWRLHRELDELKSASTTGAPKVTPGESPRNGGADPVDYTSRM